MTHRGPFQPLLFCDSVNCEVVECSTVRGGSRANVALDFWIADFNSLRQLLGRISWDMALERRELQES